MRRSVPLALIAVLGLLASSCVRDNDPDPGVRAITTDLQYKQLREKSAAPPNTIPAEKPPQLEERDIPEPTLKPFDQAPVGPVAPTKEVCPTAAPTEQADEDVSTVAVEGEPAAGEYLWKVNGSELYDRGSDPDDQEDDTRLPLPTFVKKAISDVKVDEGMIDYVLEERELSALNPNPATVRTTFHVDPEAGVSVTFVERKTPDGKTATFEPLDPIRYLVLPVKFGPENAWTDQSIDPVSLAGDTIQILDNKAYVKGRITIDACGERIRGWHVLADQTYRKGSESITRHYEYAIATHMGGILIHEHVRSPCTWNAKKEKCNEGKVADLDFKSNIGQTDPS